MGFDWLGSSFQSSLSSFTGFYLVLVGFIGFYWVLIGLHQVLNEVYRVLLGFTGFTGF